VNNFDLIRSKSLKLKPYAIFTLKQKPRFKLETKNQVLRNQKKQENIEEREAETDSRWQPQTAAADKIAEP